METFYNKFVFPKNNLYESAFINSATSYQKTDEGVTLFHKNGIQKILNSDKIVVDCSLFVQIIRKFVDKENFNKATKFHIGMSWTEIADDRTPYLSVNDKQLFDELQVSQCNSKGQWLFLMDNIKKKEVNNNTKFISIDENGPAVRSLLHWKILMLSALKKYNVTLDSVNCLRLYYFDELLFL